MRQRRTAASGPAVADGLALAEVLDSSAPLVSSVCCSPRTRSTCRRLWADCGLIPVSCVRRSSSLPRALSMSHQPPRIMDAAAGRMDDLAELRIERIVRP